jgi:hypothetical protein
MQMSASGIMNYTFIYLAENGYGKRKARHIISLNFTSKNTINKISSFT